MKRIALYVLATHLVILLCLAIWMPKKPVPKKPLTIRTVVAKAQKPTPAPPAKAAAPTPVKRTPPPPKPPVKKAPPKKAPPPPVRKKAPVAQKKIPVVPQNLVRDLQRSLAKIEENPKKMVPNKSLNAPKWISTLKVDQKSTTQADEGKYAGMLIECLQSTLDLPEFGEVKMELTLASDGQLVNMKVLKSASKRNQNFLEEELKRVKFPAFQGSLKHEKAHTFVLTFCNH